MSAHVEIDKKLAQLNVVTDTSIVGVTRVAAANNSLDAQKRDEIARAAQAAGFEVVTVAGDVRIRPKGSNL